MSSPQTFTIERIEQNDQEMVMTLDGEQDGCDQIVFRLNDRSGLRNVLIGLFQTQDEFGFEIDKDLRKGRCTIRAVSRSRPI